jgi:hypothetical protein
MFPCRSVRIVVRRIAIDKAVDKEAIEWEPPVFWRLVIGVIATDLLVASLKASRDGNSLLPFSPIVECSGSSFILIQVILGLQRIIPEGSRRS